MDQDNSLVFSNQRRVLYMDVKEFNKDGKLKTNWCNLLFLIIFTVFISRMQTLDPRPPIVVTHALF